MTFHVNIFCICCAMFAFSIRHEGDEDVTHLSNCICALRTTRIYRDDMYVENNLF